MMKKTLFDKRFIFSMTESDRLGLDQLVNIYNEPASAILRQLIRTAVTQLDIPNTDKTGGDKLLDKI